MSVAVTRGLCSASAAASPRLLALHQQHVSPVQQLISLRRHFSLSPAAVPGSIPGKAGGAAEKQTGAGSGAAAGVAEGSTGTATGPAARGAERSTGLGTPGQSEPAEAGTGLRDPTDAPVSEQHEGAASPDDAAAAAERTADPRQPQIGDSDGDVAPQAPPQPPGGVEQRAEAGTAIAGGGGGEAQTEAASGSDNANSGSPGPEGKSQCCTCQTAESTPSAAPTPSAACVKLPCNATHCERHSTRAGPRQEPIKAEAADEQGLWHWVLETVQDMTVRHSSGPCPLCKALLTSIAGIFPALAFFNVQTVANVGSAECAAHETGGRDRI